MTRINIGIRAKLAIMLAVVGLAPLLVLLMVTLDRWSSLRKEIAGEGILAVSLAESRGLGVSLTKDIQGLQIRLNDVEISSILTLQTKELPPEELKRRDDIWHTIPLDQEPMSTILNNPVARELQAIRSKDPRIAEIMVTDRYGQLYAATDRTDDFFQADEAWWTQAFNGGKGKVYIPPVDFDPATKAYTVNLCIPLFSEQAVVGVAKVKFDVLRWMMDVRGPVSGVEAQSMLIRPDGTIIYRRGLRPLATKLENWTGPITHWGWQGWRQTETEFQAFAPIHLDAEIGGVPAEMPKLILVMYAPVGPIMAPVNHMAMMTGLAGLVLIIFIFLVGLLVVDRVVTRRISQLEQATRRVAEGDLSGRLGKDSQSTLGNDEIDELTKDFNEMLARVQHSHDELQAANELKTNFIHIASHELRTPISYILGIAKLLKDNKDPERLTHAIQSIAARAKRLDDIIHAMFKLMPAQLHDVSLFYRDTSIPELLEEVYMDCFPFIEERNQRLVMESSPELPAVFVDRDKLKDIIENLVVNAIKFTPDNGTVRVMAGMHLHNSLSLAVIDQGAGIPEKELPHIFQPFYSGQEVFQHSTGQTGYQKRGMGLGLAIVRHFTELHGGTVNISTSPKGTTFTVIIPIVPPSGQPEKDTTDKGYVI